MRKVSFVFFLTILSSIIFVSCDDDSDDDSPTTSNLQLDIDGLTNLGSDFVYEGWVMVDGTPMTTGTFRVNDAGELSSTSFNVDAATLSNATKFILTIEPANDPDPAPSDQKLIAGDFSGETATISTTTAPAIGDFSMAAGALFLRTPTDESEGNNDNDQNGVWFGNPGMPPTAGLTLPELPEGWAYEGWVIGDAGPISTGTFTSFDMRDSSNPFSGTENNAGPPVPGEDFFNNAPTGETFPLDVRGRKVVISVEPVPDNSPAPFLLKPLEITLADDAATGPTQFSFERNLTSFPTGTVTR
ncbi:MAG: hypothetical protein AAF734_10685 [Bacteroidota bacterium]